MPRTNEVHAPGTWFSTIQRSFEEVPIDTANGNAISTVEFLEAAGALVSLFGSCYPDPAWGLRY
jgi:hypothetical protein